MIPKIERYPETSVNKAKTKSLIRMPTAEKAMKERGYTNACGKERKTKPQMLVANEKWLPYSGKQTADTDQMKEEKNS